jgi:Fe-S cluster assembly protein SufD
MSALERLLGEFASLGAGTGAVRQAAAQRLRRLGLPARNEDSWRYANLRALEQLPSFLPAAAPGDSAASTPAPGALALPPALPGYSRLVLIDGRVQREHSAAEVLARTERPGSENDTAFEAVSDQRLGLIATALATDPLSFTIDAPLALEIISLSSLTAPASYFNLSLRVAPGVQCRLVERHLGGAQQQGLVGTRIDVALAEGAQLQHQRLFAVSGATLLLDNLQANLAARATYELRQIAVGGASARSTAEVRLAGAQATLDWRALAAGTGPQVNDLMLTVLHDAPATRSLQLFRGLANERAHVACNVDTRVAPQARDAVVAQSLRGLLDGQGAEVDLRPQLTINTDAVQARHGATTGKLDDDLLFYLLARGLQPADARALLKSAFLGEVLKCIEPEALRVAAQQATALRLGDLALSEPWQ